MRIEPQEPPRAFAVGRRGGRLAHVADVWLSDDEVLTLRTDSGTELDVTRKDWGYYATPSLNRRLAEHGLRAALCAGVPRDDQDADRMYVMLVEAGREDAFAAYLEAEEMRVLAWLDTDERVGAAARALEEGLR
jgi:hypothetical protein